MRYHCRPSDLARGSYADYCLDEACAIAGEARDKRLWDAARAAAQDGPPMPVRRRNGQLIGAFHREI